MPIFIKINSFLLKVALSRTQDRPAEIVVVDVDGGLKQGTEGTTNRRGMCLQVLTADVRRIRSKV